MNQILNKFFKTRDKFMPEMLLRQPGFIYSVSEPFAKKRKNSKI